MIAGAFIQYLLLFGKCWEITLSALFNNRVKRGYKEEHSDGKKVFFYTSKRGSILKETFEKEVSNELAPKIKSTNSIE